MDRNEIRLFLHYFALLLAATMVVSASSRVAAQQGNRMVYNPILGQLVPEHRGGRGEPPVFRPHAVSPPAVLSEPVSALEEEEATQDTSDFVTDEETRRTHDENDSSYNDIDTNYQDINADYNIPDATSDEMSPEPYDFDEWCNDCSSDCGAGCNSSIGCGCCPTRRAGFYVGFEAVIVQPRFEENVAFTVTEADGASFESLSDTEFDYDLEFTPRAYFGWRHSDGVGFRATWWQFDHSAAIATGNPPANGFGRIDSPPFGDVDISTVIPSDTFSAATELQAYAIDLEFTKATPFMAWNFGVGCGVRYAYTEQGYIAQLRDTNDTLRGQIDYRHSLEGYGPTISLNAYRPIGCQSGIFCKARGSVLFGDGDSRMVAGEDLDLSTPFNTTRTTGRDDLLSIGEVQLGFRWQSSKRFLQRLRPFFSVAMEGQVWNGAGSGASEDGTLGFYGFNVGAGTNW